MFFHFPKKGFFPKLKKFNLLISSITKNKRRDKLIFNTKLKINFFIRKHDRANYKKKLTNYQMKKLCRFIQNWMARRGLNHVLYY
jgi:hypothetical protein